MARGARVVAGGLAVFGCVVAWRILSSSYAADVETICQAEPRSGMALRGDMSRVADWVRANLATPQGNELYSSLGDLPVRDRAERLRSAAAAVSVRPCPMVEAYEGLAADGQYRADLQQLCSSLTLPGLRDLGHDARAEALERWIDTEARSPRTNELGRLLHDAATPEDRARVLSEAAKSALVFSCDVVKTLRTPVPEDTDGAVAK